MVTHKAALSPDESPKESSAPQCPGVLAKAAPVLACSAAITSEHATRLPT